MALLIAGPKMASCLPSAIFIIGLTGVISWAIKLARWRRLRHRPPASRSAALSRPVAMLEWEQFASLIMPVLVISLVSFLETASSAQVEHQQAGTRWNENQDSDCTGPVQNQCRAFWQLCHQRLIFTFQLSICWRAPRRAMPMSSFPFLLVIVVVSVYSMAIPRAPVCAGSQITAVLNLVKPSAILKLFKICVEACISVATLVLTIATAPRMYWGVFAGTRQPCLLPLPAPAPAYY